MTKKQISKTKYLAVFTTTTLIFVIGLLLGGKIADLKMSNLDDIEKDLRIDTMAAEIQYLLMAENPCKTLNSTFLSEETYELGSKLDYMEKTRGFNDPVVLRLKEHYSLLEIRQWLFLKRTKKECNMNYDFILYFYSNKGDCDTCAQQGYVLTYIREKYPNTKIFTFDINIENPAVNTIKEIYLQNNTIPSLVINEYTYYGFKDKEAIERILKIKRY